ncbi:MAG: hypothetical protein GWP08_04890 [Nitrospiraceae bacterium]|nr:hypothetical protein [Nitrospiraceae bacterium]
MGLLIDLHVHTRAHSGCSQIDPEALIRQAVKAGLHGVVITEHQYQWAESDLRALVDRSGEPNFLLLSGFEDMSTQGHILIYGMSAEHAESFPLGLAPEEVLEQAHELGAVCIAAHPTRAGVGFDERILSLPFDAIEIQSSNLRDHEHRLAARLASDTGLRPVATSDAHQLKNVGCYATEFDDPIQSMPDLLESLRCGRFRPVGCAGAGTPAE